MNPGTRRLAPTASQPTPTPEVAVSPIGMEIIAAVGELSGRLTVLEAKVKTTATWVGVNVEDGDKAFARHRKQLRWLTVGLVAEGLALLALSIKVF